MNSTDLHKVSANLHKLSFHAMNKKGLPLATFLERLLSHFQLVCDESGMLIEELSRIINASLAGSESVASATRRNCTPGFYQLQSTLKRQVADLEYFESASKLQDPNRYFGLLTPAGEVWYNFTPSEFLEAAAEGLSAQFPATLPGIRHEPQRPASVPEHVPLANEQLLGWAFVELLLVLGQNYE